MSVGMSTNPRVTPAIREDVWLAYFGEPPFTARGKKWVEDGTKWTKDYHRDLSRLDSICKLVVEAKGAR